MSKKKKNIDQAIEDHWNKFFAEEKKNGRDGHDRGGLPSDMYDGRYDGPFWPYVGLFIVVLLGIIIRA